MTDVTAGDVVHVAADGTRWRRVGECPPERCGGSCCKHLVFPIGNVSDDQSNWLQLHGVRVDRVGGGAVCVVGRPCSALTDNGRCGVYGTAARPKLCADWPRSPADLVLTPHCGIKFEKE